MNYKLYTDASKKDNYAIMVGVILGEKNKPICEFIIEADSGTSTDILERNAMFIGLEIALEVGIENLEIHSDNLNNINIFIAKTKILKKKYQTKKKRLLKI